MLRNERREFSCARFVILETTTATTTTATTTTTTTTEASRNTEKNLTYEKVDAEGTENIVAAAKKMKKGNTKVKYQIVNTK